MIDWRRARRASKRVRDVSHRASLDDATRSDDEPLGSRSRPRSLPAPAAGPRLLPLVVHGGAGRRARRSRAGLLARHPVAHRAIGADLRRLAAAPGTAERLGAGSPGGRSAARRWPAAPLPGERLVGLVAQLARARRHRRGRGGRAGSGRRAVRGHRARRRVRPPHEHGQSLHLRLLRLPLRPGPAPSRRRSAGGQEPRAPRLRHGHEPQPAPRGVRLEALLRGSTRA